MEPLATDWLARRAELTPDAAALFSPSSLVTTYAAWNARVAQTAGFLAGKLGIGRGDRLAILAQNSETYLDLVFACGRLGAVLECASWRLAVPELVALLGRSARKAFFYDDASAAVVSALEAGQVALGTPIALGRRHEPRHLHLAAREGAALGPLTDAERPRQSDPWLLCHTGGSTGTPKAAVLTHANVTWNAINTVMTWGLRADDVAILDAPLFHAGGLNVFTTPLVYAGGASIVCPRFDPERTFDLVASGRPTLLFGVPSMLLALAEHPRWATADLARLRILITGGAPAPASLFARFQAKGAVLRLGYGLTEAGPNNFWLSDQAARQKPGRVGRPLLHVEHRIVDSNGQDIDEPGIPGELLLRGPHVMPGYADDAAATCAAIDAAGWLHTGDLAERDADGDVAIAGRKKDLFISGGENVVPAEVESALSELEAVVEAAVVPVPHARWGEVGLAFVVFRGDGAPAPELTTRLRARLAPFKVPHSFVTLPALPKTSAGKVDRSRLVALAREHMSTGEPS